MRELKIAGSIASIIGLVVCVCFSIAVIIIVIVVPLSVKTVRYDEYGILYHKFTKTVDNSTIYQPGRYYPGALYKFIKVPRIYQTVDFTSITSERRDGPSLIARTSDGLAVSLDVSFQYRLTPDVTLTLFDKFALNFRNTILSVSRDVLRDTASTFSALEFFGNRSAIAQAMKADLMEGLEQIFITLEFFQLKDVELSDNYEAIIQQKEITRQTILKNQYLQETQLIQADTNVKVNEKQAEVGVIKAAAEGAKVTILSQSEAQKIKLTTSATAASYAALKAENNLSNDQVLRLMFQHAVKQKTNAKVIVNGKSGSNMILNLN